MLKQDTEAPLGLSEATPPPDSARGNPVAPAPEVDGQAAGRPRSLETSQEQP